ncbi:SDR family NAD(P)-dependent oxidoreductase [Micromonospora sp. NPDC049836]|uniref:SDR family NAD(P)-dependent oxidoreductase n=1 Tax=Micromonospora sp. NPDC049836 TaxID=3364274 RepID=UPI0037A1AE62
MITGGSTGLALAGAKLFVEEGAYVFIQARRQEALDDAVRLIGRNVIAVQGDASDPAGASTREAKPSSRHGPVSGSTSCATARSG